MPSIYPVSTIKSEHLITTDIPPHPDQELLDRWDNLVAHNQELQYLEELHHNDGDMPLNVLEAVLANYERRSALFDRIREQPEVLKWFHMSDSHFLSIIWDLEIFPRSMETDFMTHIPSFNVNNMLNNQNRRAELYEKYKNDIEMLAVIWKFLTPNLRKKAWKKRIFRNHQEIVFLSRLKPLLAGKPALIDIFNKKKKCKALIHRHQDDPHALAVIWKIFDEEMQRKLWDKFIVPNDLEIPFLAETDQEEATTSLKVSFVIDSKDHWYQKTRRRALEKKCKNDAEARAILSLYKNRVNAHTARNFWILAVPQSRITVWDKQIVPKNTEIFLLTLLQKAGDLSIQTTREVLDQGGRREALLRKYDIETLAPLHPILNTLHEEQ